MNKKSIIGSFFFRDEGDGCLTSKYMNDSSTECPFTEGCKLIPGTGTGDKFCGKYQSVWIEDNDKHVKAELLIKKNPKNSYTYKLYWHEPRNKRAIVQNKMLLYNTE